MEPARLLIGTRDGLYDSEVAAPVVAGQSIADVAVSGSQAWAVGGRTLWRGGDRGEWSPAATSDFDLQCVLATGSGVMVGTAEAHLLELRGAELHTVESFESAHGRDRWFTPWGGPPAVRSLSDDGSTLYVNVHVGGILRSDKGTDGWPQLIDISSDVHEVLATGSGTIVAATARGLARSEDSGATWEFHTDGLHATYARAVAVDGSTVFMSASEGPRGGRACLYRAPLRGALHFERCSDFFDANIDTRCVVAGGGMVWIGLHEGRVLASEVGGGLWTEAIAPLPAVTGLARLL